MNSTFQSLFLVALIMTTAVACERKAPDANEKTQPTATGQSIGFQALNVGFKVGDGGSVEPTTMFTPADPIVASVVSREAAKDVPIEVRLVAMSDGSVRGSVSKQVTTQGQAETHLTFEKTAPWPVGRYQVEATVAGKLEASQPIEVRADLPPELLRTRK